MASMLGVSEDENDSWQDQNGQFATYASFVSHFIHESTRAHMFLYTTFQHTECDAGYGQAVRQVLLGFSLSVWSILAHLTMFHSHALECFLRDLKSLAPEMFRVLRGGADFYPLPLPFPRFISYTCMMPLSLMCRDAARHRRAFVSVAAAERREVWEGVHLGSQAENSRSAEGIMGADRDRW